VLAADANAYALTISGQSMWPRFRERRRLLVSSIGRVAIGDDVLVQLAGDQVLIKELVRRSSKQLELRQFNPDVIFPVDAAEILALHKIVGEAI
jgi:phage repressor protein C with HTH and peptisase S24 domain